jgi:predicted lipoprotein
MRNIRIIGILSLSLLSLAVSCKDKQTKPTDTFEKKDILVNLADNWIIPSYNELKGKLDNLNSNWTAFKANPSQENLVLVQTSWKSAYISFQKVKFIDFGPAMNNALPGALGTFPTDTSVIESNISSGNYDLATFSNVSAIGLPAMDYLFFETNALSNLQNTNRQQYVSDLLEKITSETNYVVTNWSTYRATFIDGTGTSSTSPFSQLVNAFCKDYDLLKNSKIGIPLGKQSLGIQRLEYLEARYSKIGKELILENFKTFRSVYTGLNGIGFDDYLIVLEKTSLNSTISTRLDFMIAEPQTWTSDLENMMVNSSQTVDDYYTYVQNSLVYLKTDMTSAFGILITYQDNDGD